MTAPWENVIVSDHVTAVRRLVTDHLTDVLQHFVDQKCRGTFMANCDCLAVGRRSCLSWIGTALKVTGNR